jgi:predicted Zn-dependent protease
VNELEEGFRELARRTFAHLSDPEVLLLNLEAEDSDFVRINGARIRQAGQVRQRWLHLEFIRDRRSACVRLPLTGDAGADAALVRTQLTRLRELLPHLPKDPYLHFATEPRDTRHEGENRLPPAEAAVSQWLEAARGLDLTGHWCSGQMVRAFASSLGQFNWHSDFSFNADWSVHGGVDQAVKQSHAGFRFDAGLVERRMEEARETLSLLARKPRTLTPGRHRVYLAPAALHELMELLAWVGFGLKSHRTAQTPLIRMVREGHKLDPRVTLTEEHAAGLAPRFTPSGFVKPERVTLIKGGRYGQCLTSARSAREYDVPVNSAVERAESLNMAAGDLPVDDVPGALGTGLLISNLWYCNYSDRNHCRITGMTRYACLWVEDGRAVAPVNVMRFDDSLFHVLGDRLEALTREREHILGNATYERRCQTSARLPGVLVDGFTFTL